MSYNLVDPTTGDLTRVAGNAGSSIPVGTLIQQYKKKPISGYLYCDGSTFDQNVYPALYRYLGTNVLPDYRECVMVGAEQNTTDTIANHDVYGEGEFKDDQIQEHKHLVKDTAFDSPLAYGMDEGNAAGVVDKTVTGKLENRAWEASGAGYLDTVSRYGTTTHGKQKAVYVYIKATSGIDTSIIPSDASASNKLVTMDKAESKYSEENILTPTDWNTLNTKARYYFSGGTPMTNSPEEVPFGLLEVINVGAFCRIQRYFAFNGKLYIRRWSGDSWNEWYRFDGISI